MNQTQTQPNTQQTQTGQSFKKKHKLEGMVVSVVVMWLDYLLIYNGLVSSDSMMLSFGMVLMFIGAAIAYYFG